MEITNIDLRTLTLSKYTTQPALLTFTGAGTVKKGTILARDTTTHKMVVFEIGGSTQGNGIPSAIAVHDVVATGAGDVACSVLTSGEVAAELLIVDADGDGSNLTDVQFDALRDFAIVATHVTDCSVLDNQ